MFGNIWDNIYRTWVSSFIDISVSDPHYTNIIFYFNVPPQQSNNCQPAIFHNEILKLRLCEVILLMKYARRRLIIQLHSTVFFMHEKRSLMQTPISHNIKAGVNNTDHLITIWCSAGKPIQTLLWTKYTPSSQQHYHKHCSGTAQGAQ